ncbi:MAG: hypothetical protein AAFU49_21165 [Pseudomonadota bacterium]
MSESKSSDIETIMAIAIRRQRRAKWAKLIEAIERSAKPSAAGRSRETSAA